MAKLTLNDIVAGYGAADLYNSNNTLIEAALENTLSLDGTTPNSMTADFDLNSNNLINGGVVNCTNIVVGGISLTAQVAAAAASAAAAATSESNAATSETNAATSETNAAASATSAQNWATLTGAQVESTDYSSKEYAIGTTVPAGSAKDWAITPEDVLVDGSDYSAFHWAQKAMAIVGTANVAVSSNDTTLGYLGTKLTALHGLTWTELNDGADEDLQISIGSHLEVGSGANNNVLNLYKASAAACYMHATNTITGNTASDGSVMGVAAGGELLLWNYENTDTILATNNAEKMRIKAGGQVAIGGDFSNERLNIHQSSAADSKMRFTNSTSGTGATDGFEIGITGGATAQIWQYENGVLQFGTNNATRLQIAADGGIFTNGATGGSQGLDTINASELYEDGNRVAEVLVHSTTDYVTGTSEIALPNVFGSNTEFDAFRVVLNIRNVSTGADRVRIYSSIDGTTKKTTGTVFYTNHHSVVPDESLHEYLQMNLAYLQCNDDSYAAAGYTLRGEYHTEFRIDNVTSTTDTKPFYGYTTWSYGPTADYVTAHSDYSGIANLTSDDMTGIYINLDNSATFLYSIQVYGIRK